MRRIRENYTKESVKRWLIDAEEYGLNYYDTVMEYGIPLEEIADYANDNGISIRIAYDDLVDSYRNN